MRLVWRGGCSQCRDPIGPAFPGLLGQRVLHLLIDGLTLIRVRVSASRRGRAPTPQRGPRQASSTPPSALEDIAHHLDVHGLFFLGARLRVPGHTGAPAQALKGQVPPSRGGGWGTGLIEGDRQLGVGASPGLLRRDLPAGLAALGGWLLRAWAGWERTRHQALSRGRKRGDPLWPLDSSARMSPQLSSTHSASGFLSYQLALAPSKELSRVCSSHPQFCPPPTPFKAPLFPRMNFSRSFSCP